MAPAPSTCSANGQCAGQRGSPGNCAANVCSSHAVADSRPRLTSRWIASVRLSPWSWFQAGRNGCSRSSNATAPMPAAAAAAHSSQDGCAAFAGSTTTATTPPKTRG